MERSPLSGTFCLNVLLCYVSSVLCLYDCLFKCSLFFIGHDKRWLDPKANGSTHKYYHYLLCCLLRTYQKAVILFPEGNFPPSSPCPLCTKASSKFRMCRKMHCATPVSIWMVEFWHAQLYIPTSWDVPHVTRFWMFNMNPNPNLNINQASVFGPDTTCLSLTLTWHNSYFTLNVILKVTLNKTNVYYYYNYYNYSFTFINSRLSLTLPGVTNHSNTCQT